MKLRHACLISSAAFLAAMLLASGGAWAQQPDLQGLVNRVQRLEREIDDLEIQINRGGGTVPAAPPATVGSGGGGVSGGAYTELDQRISALENELQTLTGNLEKSQHDDSLLSDRVDRLSKDTDFRLKTLEGASTPGAAGAAPAQSGQAAPPSATADGAAQLPPGLSPPPRPLGQISPQDARTFGSAQPAAAAAPALVGKTPEEQYKFATGKLLGTTPDYPGATAAFKAFIAQNPKDPQVSSAMFWLGDIDFAQGKYEDAVPAFGDVITKYPKSPKAGESLLDLGLSMEQLKRPKDACIALTHFVDDHPEATPSQKNRAQTARKRLACS